MQNETTRALERNRDELWVKQRGRWKILRCLHYATMHFSLGTMSWVDPVTACIRCPTETNCHQEADIEAVMDPCSRPPCVRPLVFLKQGAVCTGLGRGRGGTLSCLEGQSCCCVGRLISWLAVVSVEGFTQKNHDRFSWLDHWCRIFCSRTPHFLWCTDWTCYTIANVCHFHRWSCLLLYQQGDYCLRTPQGQRWRWYHYHPHVRCILWFAWAYILGLVWPKRGRDGSECE